MAPQGGPRHATRGAGNRVPVCSPKKWALFEGDKPEVSYVSNRHNTGTQGACETLFAPVRCFEESLSLFRRGSASFQHGTPRL